MKSLATNNRRTSMYYDEDELMETFDKWDNHSRRQKFLRRMEHKLNAKERQYSHK